MSRQPDRIPFARPCYFGDEEAAVVDALRSTWISGGPWVEKLEREVAGFCGAGAALAVSNGTAALEVSLRALGIGPGDDVLMPGFAFAGAANMTLAVGATPVFVDVDPHDWCLDAELLQKSITSRSRAVIAIHPYGTISDMEAIRSVADAHGLALIEDAAESFLSKRKGAFAGTFGDVGTFSFHATKTITTGEGGMVLTNDVDLLKRMQQIRSHGMSAERKYWHDVVGHNFRLTNLQAALGCAQMAHAATIIAERGRIARAYRDHLADAPFVTFQRVHPDVDAVLWGVALSLAEAIDRDALIKAMDDRGVELRPGFYSTPQLPAFDTQSLPISEAVSRSVVVLPIYPDLTNDEIEFICRSLIDVLECGAPSGSRG